MNVPKQLCVLMYHGIITEWTALPKEREAGTELYDVTLTNFQAQMQYLSKTNQPYWLSSTIVPFVDDNSEPFKYVSIRTNISQQKDIEQQLKHAIKETKAANEAK